MVLSPSPLFRRPKLATRNSRRPSRPWRRLVAFLPTRQAPRRHRRLGGLRLSTQRKRHKADSWARDANVGGAWTWGMMVSG